MASPLSSRPRHRGRATALVAALSLVVTPLLVAPGAYAATDPEPSPTASVEPAVEPTDGPTEPAGDPTAAAADVVAPDAELLVVDGTLQVGEELSVDPQAESWAPADVELDFTYRWSAGDDELAEQTGPTLTLAPSTVGKQISVEITGTAGEGVVDGAASDSVVVTTTGTVEPGTFVAPAPTMKGTPTVGQVLTATTGTWEPAATWKYRWLRGGTAISGATGATYTLTAADLGTAIAVEVTGSAQGYEPLTLASAPTAAVGAASLVTGAPTITGTVRVGSTVTATPGAWTPTPTLSYQWFASGAAIAGATRSTYTPSSSVKGKSLTVRVTGKKSGYTTVTKASVGRTVAAGVLSAPTPAQSGTVRVGSKVTAKPGTWTSGTSLSYRWYASGKAISGATRSTYTPTSSVKGKTLTVKVTGKKTGYTTVTKTSSGKKVAAGVLSAPKPKIKGAVKVGSKVSVTRGTWKPGASTYKYQWKVGGTSIKGATHSSYKIPSKYAGKKLTVSVKGSRSGYTTRTVTSSSAKVLRVYAKTSAPKISGSSRVGSTLKVSSRGTWSPKPSSWKYQWRANGAAIKGATKSSYKLTSAQHGKRITVTVKGVRSGYSSTSRTSSATAKVAWPTGVSKPKVTKQPQAVWVPTGKSVKFSASASGGKLKYQWQRRTVDSNTWVNVSGKTSTSYSLTARSKDTLAEYRLRATNVAGTVYSKPATLYVDSSKTDPYAAGQWYVGNFWLQSVWQTEAHTVSGTRTVDAWFMGCPLGGSAGSIWNDIDIAYVGSDGRTYGNVQGYPYATDDGCEQIVIEVAGISATAAKGGVWKIVDRSGASTYGASTQWVRGLK